MHNQIFPEILDDDLPDHFSDWIGDNDADGLMEWAELYGKEQFIAGKEEVISTL